MNLHGKTCPSASIAMKHPTLCECISALLVEKVIFPHFFENGRVATSLEL